MTESPDVFRWPVRVYYEDTDAQGVVYYANYFRFLERARTEWLRALGVDQRKLLNEDRRMFVVVRTETDFIKAARFNDELVVRTRLTDCGRARFRLDQDVHRLSGRELLVSSRCAAACVAADDFSPRRIPTALRSAIAREDET